MIVKRHPSNPSTLKWQLAGLSARAAIVTLMQRYNYGSKVVFRVADNKINEQAVPIRRLLEVLPDAVLDRPCGEVGPFGFYGGPPTSRGYQKGTILSVLCDVMLMKEYEHSDFR